MIMLDGKIPIYHFTGKCILSIHQKSIIIFQNSEYNNFIEILNKNSCNDKLIEIKPELISVMSVTPN
jgi:hypothetical protein